MHGRGLPGHRPAHSYNEREYHTLSSTDVLAQDRLLEHQGDGAQTEDGGCRGTCGREDSTEEGDVGEARWG